MKYIQYGQASNIVLPSNKYGQLRGKQHFPQAAA